MQGVETQTETVWEQANKFSVPRLGFVNKLDRMGAFTELTIESIRQRLNCEAFLVNVPVGEESNFNGVIDLPSMRHYHWQDVLGTEVTFEEVTQEHPHYEYAIQEREKLFDALGTLDDDFAEEYLSGNELSEDYVNSTIKRVLQQPNTVALHCGSALKNRGV